LRRVFEAQLGVSPIAYAQTQRLLLAKRLLTDTSLPVTDVAFASGFASVRRMNALFASRYRLAPSQLRRQRAAAADALAFTLGYRPPYAWDSMLAFLAFRAIAGVEAQHGRAFRRTLALEHRGKRHAGWIEVAPAKGKHALIVRLSPSLSRVVPQALARVRHVFDVACDPVEVSRALGPLGAATPGLRVPGGFDGFEVGVRAIVGQQISVQRMAALVGRIAQRFGTPLADAPAPLTHAFPAASVLADVPAEAIAALGMPRARAETIVTLARAVVDGLDLSPHVDPQATMEALVALRGIGPWTAQYIALRALGWPDAFLPGDLGVKRALGETREASVLARAEPWRPWRAYAVIHLWTGHREN
jgi:AraC family transcriptional regulator of adaptative response / DNA-3-methyladenine glycosylase II